MTPRLVDLKKGAGGYAQIYDGYVHMWYICSAVLDFEESPSARGFQIYGPNHESLKIAE